MTIEDVWQYSTLYFSHIFVRCRSLFIFTFFNLAISRKKGAKKSWHHWEWRNQSFNRTYDVRYLHFSRQQTKKRSIILQTNRIGEMNAYSMNGPCAVFRIILMVCWFAGVKPSIAGLQQEDTSSSSDPTESDPCYQFTSCELHRTIVQSSWSSLEALF